MTALIEVVGDEVKIIAPVSALLKRNKSSGWVGAFDIGAVVLYGTEYCRNSTRHTCMTNI